MSEAELRRFEGIYTGPSFDSVKARPYPAEIPLRLADVDLEASVGLAHEYGIYAYDAYVIGCARRYQKPLLSLDGPQCRVARRAGVDILEVET